METKFSGYEIKAVDEKGRVAIPARYMAVLRAICPERLDKVGVSIDPDGALKVMTMPAYEAFQASLDKLDDRIEEERELLTMLSALSDELELDKQNRVRLPQGMMKDLHITSPGQVVVAGQRDHMRIFSLEGWEAYRQRAMSRISKTSTDLAQKEREEKQSGGKPVISYNVHLPGINGEALQVSGAKAEAEPTAR